MHGLGGSKDQPHIQTMADAFREQGYTVLRFDTTNSFGESDGEYADATVTNYFEDLEDVVAWAKTQEWYTEPFVLAGHSLGGICTALFAEKEPQRVRGLAPISTVVSGKLSTETDRHKSIDAEWKRTGWVEEPRHGGGVKRLKWSHMEDRLKYDLLPEAHQLTMPVLLAVGEHDLVTPLDQQRVFYDALPGPKELHIIAGAFHTFREAEHLARLKEIFSDWMIRTSLSE